MSAYVLISGLIVGAVAGTASSYLALRYYYPDVFQAKIADLATSLPNQLTEAQMIDRIPNPPVQYRGDTHADAHFVSQAKLQVLCQMKVEVGKTLLGCARSNPREVFISNPCQSLDQLWAKEFCHELGHVNGWPEDHPQQ